MNDTYNSAAGMYVVSAASLGLVLGIRPLIPLPSYLAWLALIAMLVGAVWFAFILLRMGRRLAVVLAVTVFIGPATFGLCYGAMRIFYNMSLNGTLFNFS